MSRIGSSSGVRVAATPLSNVYTVLLLVGAVVLVASAVGLGLTMNTRYGIVFDATPAQKALDAANASIAGAREELAKVDESMKQFSFTPGEGGAAPAPAVGGAAAPTPEAPATPAAPETPAPAAPAAPAPETPAPAAPAAAPAAPAAN